MDEADVERSLDASVKDVSAFGLMMGFGEQYFSPYAVALKAGEQFIGWLGTLPPFIGACLQPLAAWLTDRTGRRRTLFMLGAGVQALTFVPLALSIFLPRPVAYPVLLASVVVYFAGVHFATPAWNSVMGDLVPPERRGRFFGMRSSVFVVSQWLAAVMAGVGLYVFEKGGHELDGFLLIFSAAFVARAISIAYLGRMAEPPYVRPTGGTGMLAFLRGVLGTNFGRFVLFVAAMNFSVAVSGPYFTVFMLRDLRFSYMELTVSHAVIVIGQILVLQRWGRLGDAIGNRRILGLTAVGVTLIPFLWQFARSPVVVWAIQAYAGMVWGGFNLAAGNFIFDSLPHERRASGVAHFNFVVGLGVLAGGVLGIAIVGLVPSRYPVLGLTVTFFSHLQVVMLISGLLRAATVTMFLPRFREVREVPNVGVAEILLRATAVRSIAEMAGDFLTWYRREKGKGD